MLERSINHLGAMFRFCLALMQECRNQCSDEDLVSDFVYPSYLYVPDFRVFTLVGGRKSDQTSQRI